MISREELYDLYWDKGMTVPEVADFLGVHRATPLRWLKKFNIERRNDHFVGVGEANPFYGKKHTDKTREKMSENHADVSGENNPMYGVHMCGHNAPRFGKELSEEAKKKIGDASRGRKHSEETKRKIGEGETGEKHWNWKGGISHKPYCYKFNYELKEYIRDKFNRTCFLCGRTEGENGRKLSVHHVDYNKKQGCDSEDKWVLVPLCNSCHGKSHYNREYFESFILEMLGVRQ